MRSIKSAQIILAFLMLAIVVWPTYAMGRDAATADTASALTAVQQQADSLSFTLAAHAYAVQDGQIEAPWLDSVIAEPGAPALPYYSTLIALPPGADARVVVQASGESAESVGYLQPAGTPYLDQTDMRDDRVQPERMTLQFTADAALYATDAAYPAARYSVSEPMYVRDVRVVRLELYPFQYNPVQQALTVADLTVSVTFDGAQPVSRTAGGDVSAELAGSILNADQAQQWRSLPVSAEANATTFPIGVETFKIEVDGNGIYEVTYADLAAAGMNVSAVNPNTFEMMYMGSPVSYAFVGDNDAAFEPGEAVRFYGWEYDGTRYQAQHVKYNVFWLWAGGDGTRIPAAPNGSGYTTVDTAMSSVTADPQNVYFSMWNNNWSNSDNPPAAYHWRGLAQTNTVYPAPIELPFPATAGPDAAFEVEVFSVWPGSHRIRAWVNGDTSTEAVRNWSGKASVNATGTAPLSALTHGENEFSVIVDQLTSPEYIFLHRVTVDYLRELKTEDNQIMFEYEQAGAHRFRLDGFTVNDPSQVLAWDITVRQNPVAITLTGSDITGSSPYTYNLNADHAADAAFAVMTDDQVVSPVQISSYTAPSLEPGNGAQWLAIGYGDFLPEVERLAAHRAATSGLSTHVVDVDDVLNQYSYGLRMPDGIKAYIDHAVASWNVIPEYVVLAGDSTLNPKQQPCLSAYGCLIGDWSTDVYAYVPTWFQAIDRFSGFVPSDHFYATVIGNDNLADLAVGRLTAETVAEMTNIVDKIILYEDNLTTPEDWMRNMLFVSDDYDPSAGDFCFENGLIAQNHVPDMYEKPALCLPSTAPADIAALRAAMFEQINVTGTTAINYRGHGGIADWADNAIMRVPQDLPLWQNADRPLMIISADCLDGYFVRTGTDGLGESLLRHGGGGTAAHWSSTGLGFSWEHSVLHEGFYDGLFGQNLTAVGDAAVYAKLHYFEGGYDLSEMYAFTLQGDPAMQLYRPNITVDKSTTTTGLVEPGDTVEYTIDLTNSGTYPPFVTLVDTLPAGMTYVGHTISAPATVAVSGQQITFSLTEGLGSQDSVLATITAQINTNYNGGTALINMASATGTGVDLDSADNTDTATVALSDDIIYLNLTQPGNLNGLPYDKRDIVVYNAATGQWAMHFDGSDTGLSDSAVLDAFLLYTNNRIVMSFTGPTSVPGVPGTVQGNDLVLFTPSSLGNNTAGSFILVLDGSDIELDSADEDIDAITIVQNKLAVSTTGPYSAQGLTGDDEDVLLLSNPVFGPNTSGTWSIYFDGSDIGFTGEPRDVKGLWHSGNNLYLSMKSDFTILGLDIAGTDIAVCRIASSGSNTSCNLANSGVYWQGARNGIANGAVDDFSLVLNGLMPEMTIDGLERLP